MKYETLEKNRTYYKYRQYRNGLYTRKLTYIEKQRIVRLFFLRKDDWNDRTGLAETM